MSRDGSTPYTEHGHFPRKPDRLLITAKDGTIYKILPGKIVDSPLGPRESIDYRLMHHRLVYGRRWQAGWRSVSRVRVRVKVTFHEGNTGMEPLPPAI